MVETAAQPVDRIEHVDHTGQESETARHGASTPGARQSGLPRLAQLVLRGFVGAVTVTVLNETARRLVPHAPRMEVIGERAVSQTMRALNLAPPNGRALYRWTMAGDLLSNTLYYSMVGSGTASRTWRRGTLLGVTAGIGAVMLPRPFGLGDQPDTHTPRTQVLTIAWYLAGGLAAAAAAQLLQANGRPTNR